MSLKQEIETWVTALGRYDNNEFDEALGEFDKIADTSKILFNMGVIFATLGEHSKAVECYQRAIRLDQYLAVAYFQQGVSNFLLGDFEEALANFNDTLLYLRGNTMIDYAQLGLLFKLYSCEVLFNRGLCYIYLQQVDPGMQDLNFAVKEKVVEDHNVIDEAIREQAEGYTVFSIPVGVVYRPNEAKVRNLKTKDYLGKARLVAASDRANAFTGFAGSEIKNQPALQAGKTDIKDDRPAEKISFAATNLVKPELQSRMQQQPPAQGGGGSGRNNVFPPTPPPENDKSGGMSRGASVRNGPKPQLARLNIESSRPRFEKMSASPQDDRRRPPRSQSQTPQRGPSRRGRGSDDGYEDLYDEYQSRSSSRRPAVRDTYTSNSGSMPPGFEIVERRGSNRNNLKIKVHAEDVRYILVPQDIEFPDLVDRIRDKFGLRRRFKIKVRDDDSDGDMITMGDQDDLDIAIDSSNGKMEIWIQEVR
ncbi:hypothetical protein MKZ38_000285 [Zalerion maritima]|uniref:PB1 domain-containing protein n=1 Tax=Zalerion maritima TaxID=339359 RepID=A0AAD5WSL4_9PEZI|nr:hypothetical protein MKZ38_000285 [Zalerion maritima]